MDSHSVNLGDKVKWRGKHVLVTGQMSFLMPNGETRQAYLVTDSFMSMDAGGRPRCYQDDHEVDATEIETDGSN